MEIKYSAARAQMRMCLRELKDLALHRLVWTQRTGDIDSLLQLLDDTGCLEESATALIGNSLRDRDEAEAIEKLADSIRLLMDAVEGDALFHNWPIEDRWQDSRLIMGLPAWSNVVNRGREAYQVIISSTEGRAEIVEALDWIISLEEDSEIERLDEVSHDIYCRLWMNSCLDGCASELVGSALEDPDEASAIDHFATEFNSILTAVGWDASQYVRHPRFHQMIDLCRECRRLIR